MRTAQGAIRCIDFMPRRVEQPVLVRIVEGVEGRVDVASTIACRFDYGSLAPWTRKIGDAYTATALGNGMALRTQAPTEVEESDIVSRFTVCPGDSAAFVLQWYPSHVEPPEARDPYRALKQTEREWEKWHRLCKYEGAYGDAVRRSLITLKALTHEPTGGCIAAATTSLPERFGGEKNWDYRYAWIRDSAFTIDALVEAGYQEEARAWRDWLLRMVAADAARLQIAYTVTGGRHLHEWEAHWLGGYEGSRPVRIGNQAYDQFQLGIYGEMMQAITSAHEAGIEIDDHGWQMLRSVTDYVCENWRRPDSGIWESREKRKHYTNSRVMAWLALDCALRIMERDRFEGPRERYRSVREDIRADVLAKGYNERMRSFVESYESDALDASVLLIPIVGFLPAGDERVRSTVERIERDLLVDGFIVRHSESIGRHDGRTTLHEGAFLACNAWLVQVYCLAGRIEDARALFERLLAIRNDVGLLSEEYDVERKRLCGNFPQTFSHCTLVNAAVALTKYGARSGS